MKKEICKFIVAFLVIAISLLVIDKAVGVIGRYAMLHMDNRKSEIGKKNYLFNRVNDADVLIVGSSRASHHYIPQMLQECITANYAVDSVHHLLSILDFCTHHFHLGRWEVYDDNEYCQSLIFHR